MTNSEAASSIRDAGAKCLFVRCDEIATVDRLCFNHHDYAHYELANDKYRTEKPPCSRGWIAKERRSGQMVLM